MQNILGISLGTRFMGMAVIYNGELSDYRVRTFYKAWTEQKQSEMIGVITKAVGRYGITKIVVKSPKPSHCSENINRLMHEIRRMSEDSGIMLTTCTISALKMRHMSNDRGNKQVLVQAICKKYPQHKQLAALCAKKRIHRTLNHVKMFEAIACAEMGL